MGTIRGVVNEALAALSREFSALYSRSGRPSIAPEKLLRAMLLQAFYSIRSERQLMERLEFDLLFRWFVGIGVDDAAWDHRTFSKNREQLEGDIAAKLLNAVLSQPRVKRLLSTDFSVDGTLDRGLGVDEELPAEADGSGDPSTPGGGGTRSGFSWPEALQRDARFDDRSGGTALSQGTGKEAKSAQGMR